MNRIKAVFGCLLMIAGSYASAGAIDDFKSSWAGKAIKLQSQVDHYEPISKINILGTHNSYNSSEYANDGYVRYVDPQQKHSLLEQLRLGARFLELDVHWAVNASNYRYHLILCHGTDSDVGCGLSDKFFTEGLSEIETWLSSSDSDGQVLILYIEDHSDNVHGQMFDQIMASIGDKVYPSQGCGNIPAGLTKDQVLSAGKNVIIWKDGRSTSSTCSSHTGLKNLVYTGLGNIDRMWEDRTILGNLGDAKEKISATDVAEAFKQGRNIVNLDDMTYNDGRNEASIWSWAKNEPNNAGSGEDCVLQLNSGRWADVNCQDTHRIHPYACHQTGTHNWDISNLQGQALEGSSACASLGSDWVYDVPTSGLHNENLRKAKEISGVERVWLNLNDIAIEGNWQQEQWANVKSASHYYSPVQTKSCPSHNASFDGANCHLYTKVSGVSYWDYSGGRYYSPTSPGVCLYHDASFDGANCFMFQKESNLNYWNYGNGYYYTSVLAPSCPHHEAELDGKNCKMFDKVSGLNYFSYSGAYYYSKTGGAEPCPYNDATFDGANCHLYTKVNSLNYFDLY